jgi:hypothetical protein
MVMAMIHMTNNGWEVSLNEWRCMNVVAVEKPVKHG